jgi:CheY-like chemotaxis protein
LARKILLADDSVTAQNMGRKILADAGYEVVAVNNGSAALKKILELKPDLVILDVYMPGYSGLEVCQRLKETPDTARIPVLLTVGKLEPFKPEESQRVRADGYIIKPFEASELLSALSKLEDRIVPRSEASKSGRFARAIAAVEEGGRITKNDANSEDEGWRSRIQFPKKKAEAEEQSAEEQPIYNAMNRDLRTVVDKSPEATERAADKKGKKKEEQHPHAEKAAEPTLDVAAIAPPGFPKDVTPEEAAAIAAAAAQIQMLTAAAKEESETHAESRVETPAQVEEVVASQGIAEVAPTLSAEVTQPVAAEEKTENSVVAADNTVEPNAQPAAEETVDEPVTMAAASVEAVPSASAVQEAASSRWHAVAVAIEGEEASISLEQEMQKAYAAFVAEETAGSTTSTAFSPAAPEASLIEQLAASAQPMPESASNIIASDEAAPESVPVPAVFAEQPESVAVAQAEAVVSEPAALVESAPAAETAPEPVVVPEIVAASSPAEDIPVTQSLPEALASPVPEATPEPVAEIAISAVESQVPNFSSDPNLSSETVLPEQKFEPAISMATPSRKAVGEEDVAESETIKNTAAAWENWRQIRDTKVASGEISRDIERDRDNDTDKNEEVAAIAEAAAMAVAAGAEQAAQAVTGHTETPADVASIVDSVLADLRPRLLAEISRKIAEKK